MDMRNRPTAAPSPVEMPLVRASNGKGGLLHKLLIVVLILTGISVIACLANRGLAPMMADSAIKTKEYQAVFLTNGQVYFGKVSKVDGSYVKLTDIYYLQVQQQVQPEDKTKTSTQTPQVSLAKLGGELHGPEDVMYISRQQVLFWENLKDDGKVTKAIKDYTAAGNK